MKYNVYCDESCHLEHDNSPVMILGSMACSESAKKKIYNDIREIKVRHGIDSHFEIKWTKVSSSKIDFYLELLNYFWETDALTYRGLICNNKKELNHSKYNNGDYDLWYYKMYFLMLDPIIVPDNEYHILVDIKDTRGGNRVAKLRDVLCNNIYDFKQEVINQIGQINSRESEILQLADLMNGALGYYHRGLYSSDDGNEGKKAFIDELLKHTKLDQKTARNESKFNLFIWQPKL